MHLDVAEFHEFYSGRLGRTALRLIDRRIGEVWPDARGLSVLGVGHATPFLDRFRDGAARVVAVMPAAQGVMHWPAHAANLTALAEEWELPLPDAAFDRVLLIHAIETTEHLRPMLREAWRVLNSGGRLLAVTPNRRGLWARAERTPFAQGRPYSLGQLRKLLRDNLFSPVQWASALYPPPADWGFLLKAADAVEDYGSRWFSTFAGVVMIEATKQIYAATPSRAGARVRGIVAVPEG